MKTLYININGENIQSAEDIIVVGRPDDAIINKFYFELGKGILKGVVAPGATSIKKKDIVTDFKAHDEKSFNNIVEQWEILKQGLLGENPSGTRTIKLSDEYISWLQNSSQPAYTEIAKSLYKRGGNVEVSLDKIYKNAIGIIVNNIEPEECKDCGQFVVNDDVVTDDSAIAFSIQDRVPQIAFMPFEDFGKRPKFDKNPCECEPKSTDCPICGKNPCECKISVNWEDLFPVERVTLGETHIFEIEDKGELKCEEYGLQLYSHNFGKAMIYIQGYEDKFITWIEAYRYSDVYRNSDHWLPKRWESVMGISCTSTIDQVIQNLRQRGVKEGPRKSEDALWYITSDERYQLLLSFENKRLHSVAVFPLSCPYCGNDCDIEFWDGGENGTFSNRCPRCNHHWGSEAKCPNCNSNNIECGDKFFQCNDCGYRKDI